MRKIKIWLTSAITLFTFNTFSQENYAIVDIEDPGNHDELNAFFSDSILNQYKVYFTGENHQYAYVNSDLEFKILTYLHEHQGVNHFLFEQSPATGYIITQAVTGNEDDEFNSYLRDKFFDPFYNLVKQIRKFNDTLPENEKIRVHGIDVERFPAFSIFALHKLTDTLAVDGKTGIIYEAIEALYTSEFIESTPDEIYNDGGTRMNLLGDQINAWETLASIIDNSDLYQAELEKELGENYSIFSEILLGLQNGHDWYVSERRGDLTAPLIRERFMVDQFSRVDREFPNSKFYGQFGRCHLHAKKESKRCYSHNMRSVANRLNESKDSTLNGKVLTIPVYYEKSKGYDQEIITNLELDYRFNKDDKVYLIDVDYLDDDNPVNGFTEDLPYVIVNTYYPKGFDEMYSFELQLEEYHFGGYYGNTFFNKIGSLNSELTDIGVNGFTNKFLTYSFVFDYIAMNENGVHFGYNYFPEVSNGDRFKLSGQSFSYGGNYPFGNKFVMSAIGVYFTYGSMKLKEENNGDVANLIQSNGENIIVYKNDMFMLVPNLDFRLTLPVVSLNARVGYNFDVSGKYWKLDGKMKDFSKTSFSSPYIQLGASLNIKYEN